MDEFETNTIEELLPAYFSGDISDTDKKKVDKWRMASKENADLFNDYRRIWRSANLLADMEAVDTKNALEKVHRRISFMTVSDRRVFNAVAKIAAILFIPLLCYSLIVSLAGNKYFTASNSDTAWQTLKTGSGMRGAVELPDGSKVTLNSGSEISYPARFGKGAREVKLSGEGFFEVTKDKKHPFVVNTGKLNVEVLGTTFNVMAYKDDRPDEVVLLTGSVNLYTGDRKNRTERGLLKPGQRAVFSETGNDLKVMNVDTEKYAAWKDGYLIFRDDSMDEVISRLERWFNVDIYVRDKKIYDYEITARFHDETLRQVLTLLNISSGIKYRIEESSQLKNGEFSRTKIFLTGE